jgi:hypothetical protein
MKVLAVKNVEPLGNLWAVRYTRLTRKGVKQDAYFLCDSQEEAKAKRAELLDVLQYHDGVYVSAYKKRTGDIGEHLREYSKQRYILTSPIHDFSEQSGAFPANTP